MVQCLSYLVARKIGRLSFDEVAGANCSYLEATAVFLVVTASLPVIDYDLQVVGQHLRLSSTPVSLWILVSVAWSCIPAIHHDLVIFPERPVLEEETAQWAL